MVINPVLNNGSFGVQPTGSALGRDADSARDSQRPADNLTQAVRDASGAGREPSLLRQTEAQVVAGAGESVETDLDAERLRALEVRSREDEALETRAEAARQLDAGNEPGSRIDVFA